ncbi:MAG: TRAP transporter small permease subunit [Betaproteobacteria bacterium]|nr:MAG: TRAP transporter small permease subunit [Betaproteobacteria bacterium]
MRKIIYGVDELSRTVGHVFSWCVVVLIAGTVYEVFMRYALNDPTGWAFDLSYICYGALFFMAGAYTLSRGGHVRCDVFYRLLSVRRQAWVDLVLYVLFYFPGVLALVSYGWADGFDSMRIRESSISGPAGVPIWPMKMLVPFGAGLLTLQGIAEMLRCVVCLRENEWPPRLHDVEELELQLIHLHAKGELAPSAGAAAAAAATAGGAQ